MKTEVYTTAPVSLDYRSTEEVSSDEGTVDGTRVRKIRVPSNGLFGLQDQHRRYKDNGYTTFSSEAFKHIRGTCRCC